MSVAAERLYSALRPLAEADEANGWALAHVCVAIARMLDTVADLSRDDEARGRPGWAIALDPDATPAEWLPWLAQFVGVTVPVSLPEDARRLRIRETDGFKRGTPAAVRGAARQHLTGTGTVYLTERHGSPYLVTVATVAGETPSPAAVNAALQQQKPAGLILTHAVVVGGDFNALRDTHPDFADVTATFSDFDDLRADPTRQ